MRRVIVLVVGVLAAAVCSACGSVVAGHPVAAGPPPQRSFSGVDPCRVFPPATLAALGIQHTAADDAERASRDAYSQAQLAPGQTLPVVPSCLFSLLSGADDENRVAVTFFTGRTMEASSAASRDLAASAPTLIAVLDVEPVAGYQAYAMRFSVAGSRCTLYLAVADRAQLMTSAVDPDPTCKATRRIAARAAAALPTV